MLFGKVPFAETKEALFATIESDEVAEDNINSWREYCALDGTWSIPAEDKRNIIRCQDGN